MIERLPGKVREFDEELRAEMEIRIGDLVSWMDAQQAKTEANHEDWMDAVETLMNVSLETTGTCLEKIEAIQGAVETRLEACLEEAAVIIGATEDRTRGRVIPTRC